MNPKTCIERLESTLQALAELPKNVNILGIDYGEPWWCPQIQIKYSDFCVKFQGMDAEISNRDGDAILKHLDNKGNQWVTFRKDSVKGNAKNKITMPMLDETNPDHAIRDSLPESEAAAT